MTGSTVSSFAADWPDRRHKQALRILDVVRAVTGVNSVAEWYGGRDSGYFGLLTTLDETGEPDRRCVTGRFEQLQHLGGYHSSCLA